MRTHPRVFKVEIGRKSIFSSNNGGFTSFATRSTRTDLIVWDQHVHLRLYHLLDRLVLFWTAEENSYTVDNTPLVKYNNEVTTCSILRRWLPYVGTVREGLVLIQQSPLERTFLRLDACC